MVEPVVVIHGLFHGCAPLRGCQVAAPDRVVVLDLLGYGGFRDAQVRIDLPAQVEHVVAELNRARIERVHVVGHSVGGAVAVLLSSQHPQRVASVVNVEGNFTLADAFWSSRLAEMPLAGVEALLLEHCRDIPGWLGRMGIEPTPIRVESTRLMFDAQPASTVLAMARSVVEITSRPDYLTDIQGIFDTGVPMHLLAGERSREKWDVPDFVLRQAASLTIQPGTGHMLPLEEPDAFLALVLSLLRKRNRSD